MTINKLLNEYRKFSLNQSLQFIRKYLSSKDNIITEINLLDTYNDYPKLYQYATSYVSPNNQPRIELRANAISMNEKKAYLRAIMETIERWYLFQCDEKILIKASYNDLINRGLQALNPRKVVCFSENQLKLTKYHQFRINEDTVFLWTKMNSLYDEESIYTPASLVYFLKTPNDSPLIRLPDSTGAAAAFSLLSALYNGICEVIERDAFMITYLNKLNVKRIDLEKNSDKKISFLINYLKRYLFDINLYDITTDIKIPTSLCILVDKTGGEPKFSLGAKSDINWQNAIYFSVLESLQGLSSLRDAIVWEKVRVKYNLKENIYSVNQILKKLLFWSNKDPKKLLSFLFSGSKIYSRYSSNKARFSFKDKYIQMYKILQKARMDIYWNEIAPDILNKYNIHIVRVLIPSLQPMPIDQEYPYLGGERISRVPQILGYKRSISSENDFNKLPHPFG